jgi:hypothetical protein
MLFQRLSVVPSNDSLQYLYNMFAAAPFLVELDTITVDVMISTDPLVAAIDNTYTLTPKHLRLYYDSNLQTSSWIMSFESPDLQKRYRQLQDLGVTPALHNYYHPHAVIVRYAPPLSKNYRRFMTSMSNIFGDCKRSLMFGLEHTVDVDLNFPPEKDYNTAMDSEVAGKTYMTGH